MKKFQEIVPSRNMRVALSVTGALIVALLIFHAGIVVGSHRHQFNRFDMDQNTEHGFRSSFLPGGLELPHGFIPNNHGAVGVITAITLPTVTIQTREGTKETILVSSSTALRTADDSKVLSVGSQITVLGGPDSQGRIDAKLIRVFPPQPTP